MDYMTPREASEKWGVSSSNQLLPRRGRIPGAVKMAGVWLLPKRQINRRISAESKNKAVRNCKMGKVQ